ncbi:MAG: ATP-binding protein [Bacteroidia bacterium]|nr:ATP-binding protein [Bacteroidia bacterium]
MNTETQQSTITAEMRSLIVKNLKERRQNHGGTDTSFARSMGINPAQYSRIVAGNYFQVISDQQWVRLAHETNTEIRGKQKWNTAATFVFKKVTEQLRKCQDKSLCGILVDDADIGKTHAAKEYAKNNKFAVYIDCSQYKKKRLLIGAIAKAFGVDGDGSYDQVVERVMHYINNYATNPLVILDEAGDLDQAARLELKRYWNATEQRCGWYQIGAEGLREIIRRSIEHKRIGAVETFSRFGNRFQRFTPESKEDKDRFAMQQAALIIKANATEKADQQKVLVKTKGSLRRIHTELSKL